jgi:hypothetical protein
MAPLRLGLTPARRAIGVAAVGFLLAGAVVFYHVPDVFTSRAAPSKTADFSASPVTTSVPTESATPGGLPSSAVPSRTSTSPTPTSSTTPGAGDRGSPGSAKEEAIHIEHPAVSARTFQTVRIQGVYRGAPDCSLRVQGWRRHKWFAFPLTAKTDRSGQFTAYVELGEPGLYWLRVLDPDSNVKSEPFQLVIKG